MIKLPSNSIHTMVHVCMGDLLNQHILGENIITYLRVIAELYKFRKLRQMVH